MADDEQGLASGLVNTSFQVNGAVVSAVITSGDGVRPELSALDNGVVVIIAAASLGLLAALFGSFAWWRARLAPAAR